MKLFNITPVLLVIVFILSGCGNKSMDTIIHNEENKDECIQTLSTFENNYGIDNFSGFIAEWCQTNGILFKKIINIASEPERANIISDLKNKLSHYPYLYVSNSSGFNFYFLSTITGDIKTNEVTTQFGTNISLSIKDATYEVNQLMIEIYTYSGGFFSLIDYVREANSLSEKYCAYISDGYSYFSFVPRDPSIETSAYSLGDGMSKAQEETLKCYQGSSYMTYDVVDTIVIGRMLFGKDGGGIPAFQNLFYERIYNE